MANLMKNNILFILSLFAIFSACGGSNTPQPIAPTQNEAQVPTQATSPIALTIVGTADVHGHIEMLPLFGGYMDILRSDPNRAVLLIDGGDMFQGTLASNLKEGAPIVDAYNLLKYDAVTIGNHEFDFGPVGEDATVSKPGQDPRGALKARAASAHFPFLSSNILDQSRKLPIDWPNVSPTTIVTQKGILIGIIGISTFETPKVTLAANVIGLEMAPLAASITTYAKELRDRGAQVIVVAAHAGGICDNFSDPKDHSSCVPHQEIFDVANELAPGTVHAIVAGHTHGGVAHEVNGIAIIESYSRGQAFGRIDLLVATDGSVELKKIHTPRALCLGETSGAGCDAGRYEEKLVQPNVALQSLATEASKVAEKLRSTSLDIELTAIVTRSRGEASPLGNLFADLMLQAHPKADLALVNGGSLRAELPKGVLTYGALFEATPFDNHFAFVSIRARDLKTMIATNLSRDNGILSVSGITAQARCQKGSLEVTLYRAGKKKKRKRIADEELLMIVTSDFLASGGDGLIGPKGAKAETNLVDGGPLIRDAMASVLTRQGGTLDPAAPALFSPKRPRISYPGPRPLSCP